MIFEQWQATGVSRTPMSEDEAGAYRGLSGRIYEGGFMVADQGYWLVPLPQEERTFATYQEAERCLWDEWCDWAVNDGEG